MNAIFIPGNVPSSKNSKQWTGKILIDSEVTRRYRANTAIFWKAHRTDFLKMVKDKPKPLLIGFHFVRNSRRRFDFCNMVQILQDMAVQYGWLPDDNCDEMLPFPMQDEDNRWYAIDKNNPGVYIKVQ
jgi:hypothetical protein